MPHIPSDGEGDAITSDFVPPKGQEAEQDFIAMCGKLLPGSGLYLFVDTLDDGRANVTVQQLGSRLYRIASKGPL